MNNRAVVFLLLLIIILVFLIQRCTTDEYDYSAMQIKLIDTNSPDNKPLESIQVGNSLSLGFSGLSAGAPLQVYLNDDEGKEWSVVAHGEAGLKSRAPCGR